MRIISSRQNSWFKRVREAIREHNEEIVIEGPKAVSDAVAGGWTPIAIFVRYVGDVIRQPGVPVMQFTHDVFDSLAETRSPQGVIGLFERPRATLESILARRDTVAVALDGVQDPGNVGTIVRLAAAFDAAGVLLLPGCADPFGPKAIRASVGAILNVRVAEVTPEELLASGRVLYAADARGTTAEPPARDAILLFGNEGSGVSEVLAEHAAPLAIPMSDRVESLNVASSAAILLAGSFARRT
ncbi:MAG TPA: RNA methyltransferase [Thermoanaerobaculia bacterium]